MRLTVGFALTPLSDRMAKGFGLLNQADAAEDGKKRNSPFDAVPRRYRDLLRFAHAHRRLNADIVVKQGTPLIRRG